MEHAAMSDPRQSESCAAFSGLCGKPPNDLAHDFPKKNPPPGPDQPPTLRRHNYVAPQPAPQPALAELGDRLQREREAGSGRVTTRYFGITYWGCLGNPLSLWLWRKVFCRRGWHLWDEVWSLTDHYMSCDACELYVGISKIRTEGE